MKNISRAGHSVLQTKLEASEKSVELRAKQAENELRLVREQMKSQFEE